MGIITALLLIVLGLIAARDFLVSKFAALTSTLDALYAQKEYIGIAGLLIGFIWLLQAMSMLGAIGAAPLLVIENLVGCLLMMLLGLIFSLPLLHKFMNEPTPSFLPKVDAFAAKLAPKRNTLGLTAIVIGLIILV